MDRHDYYVYVYIDPRNYEEFYLGKGRGTRKAAHLNDKSDSEKVKRIAAIHKEGLEPLVRVIVRGLTEAEALLVEKTLLWKLGKWTTNIATGHFAEKFRRPNTLHRELQGFDFEYGLYYYNVGENNFRSWDDYVKFGFISGGRGARYRDAMLAFNEGDVFFAYLKGSGFVGVGRILERAKMIQEIRIKNRRLLELPLVANNPGHDCDDAENSEYVCLVEWIASVPREQGRWKPNSGLYTTTHVRARLDGQPKTVKFVEQEFGISIGEFIT